MRILVTGGGTGGHVGPALAVIQTLRDRAEAAGEPPPVFRYVGSAAGIEAKLAKEAGVEFVGVASGKLRRSSRGPIGLLTSENLRDIFRVPVGLGQSMRAVRSFRPDVVLATGGYVSVPPVMAAAALRVPILTHEQTVTIGLANRINGRFATRIALTFEGAKADLPPALRKKAFVTGNPVRKEIFDGDRARAVKRFGFDHADDDLPCIYVTGGAQGSRIINRGIEDALPELIKHCRILHQCGRQPAGDEQDLDRMEVASLMLPPDMRRRYQVMAYVESDAIGDAYALADLIVSRSGAGTVTEACALGKPALYIPLVPTGGDEQTRNARRSADAGAAAILTQAECDGAHLRSVIPMLLSKPELLRETGEKARKLATPRAADDLTDALVALENPLRRAVAEAVKSRPR